jgi:glutamine cyclotransferase
MKTIITSICCLYLSACGDKNKSEQDTRPPLITITTPTNNQSFTNGQSIRMTGTITDDQYVAESHIHVTNKTTGELLMDVHLYPGASSASFDQSITASAGKTYKITVTALDKQVNEGRTSVEVTCN